LHRKSTIESLVAALDDNALLSLHRTCLLFVQAAAILGRVLGIVEYPEVKSSAQHALLSSITRDDPLTVLWNDAGDENLDMIEA
jgi:hypothetical protein